MILKKGIFMENNSNTRKDTPGVAPDRHPLDDSAMRLGASAEQFSKAVDTLVQDKASRGIFGKLIDFLSVTEAERGKADAKQSHTSLGSEVKTQAEKWLDEKTISILDRSPDQKSEWMALAERRLSADIALEQVSVNLTKANKVLGLLDDAKSDVASASANEAADMLSSNKILSVLSAFSTTLAKRKAAKAVDAAREFLADHGPHHIEDVNNNIGRADFISDVFGPLPVDVLSMFDYANLERLHRSLDRIYSSVEKPIQKLESLNDALNELSSSLEKSMDKITDSISNELKTELPANIHDVIDHGKGLDYRSFTKGSTNLKVDWNSVKQNLDEIAELKKSESSKKTDNLYEMEI